MKKVITLILVTMIAIMLLAGCSSSSEVAELRQEIENLQSELSQLKEQMSNTQSTTPDAELPEAPTETFKSENSEVTPRDATTKTVTSDMLDYLTTQLQSANYADWNAVATCDYATEEHILTAAQQCAAIPGYSSKETWVKTIATSICKNPAATGDAIKELSNSPWYEVWNIAAQSTYADEEALISIAQQCAAIPGYSSKETWAKTIAASICKNPAATGDVIKELSNSPWYEVWNIAAQSTHADEEALISIAKQCAAIPGYSSKETWAKTIATSICENPAVTGNVLKELAISDFTTVTDIAHKKLEELQ